MVVGGLKFAGGHALGVFVLYYKWGGDNMLSVSSVNYRCKYNEQCIPIVNKRTKTRLRGYDIADKSKQYFASVRAGACATKTEYIKHKTLGLIKLDSLIKYLRKNKCKWYITSDRKYITTNVNGITTYKIIYTNGVLIHNKLDRKQQKRIYTGK